MGANESAGKRQGLGPAAIGEETELPDAHEASRENVLAEAAQELDAGYGHLPLLVPVRVILPAERDLVTVEGQQAVIADGDAMGVPPEVTKHAAGRPQRRFRVYDPLLTKECIEEVGESAWLREPGNWAGEDQLSSSKSAAQSLHEFGSEHRARTATGRKNGYLGRIQRWWSGENPPAGMTQCTCGCKSRFCPHVCRMLMKPISAPKRFGLAATSSMAAELARKSRS